MKSNSFSISIIVFILIASCNSQDAHDHEHEHDYSVVDTASIKRSIDSLGGVVQKAHDNKDGKLLSSTWAADGILTIAGRPPIKGRDAIVSFLGEMPSLPPGGTMTIHPSEIEVLGAEWAYVFGIDSLKYTRPDTKKEVTETSTFFVLVKKTSEGWQTFRETLTPNQGIQK